MLGKVEMHVLIKFAGKIAHVNKDVIKMLTFIMWAGCDVTFIFLRNRSLSDAR